MVAISTILDFKYIVPKEYETAYLPVKATVPYTVAGNLENTSIIKQGAKVSEGQIIALGNSENCNVHAPIPGIVKDFATIQMPDGTQGEAVTIQLEGSFTYLGKDSVKKTWDNLSPEKIITAISEKGVVNTFKYMRALAPQIRECKAASRNYLIVRMYDLDPTCCTDAFVCAKFMHKIFESASIVAKALEAKKIVFLYDSTLISLNEPEKNIQLAMFNTPTVFIPIDTSYYPCGGHNEIIDLIKKSNAKDIEDICINDLMIDAVTLYSVYEAVIHNIPVMDRFVYVDGDSILQSKMFKVRIGTPIINLIQECGGLTQSNVNVIVNGLIRGNEIVDLTMPITKNVKSLYVVSKKQSHNRKQYACVRCGNCRQVCPAHLHPDELFAHSDYILKNAVRCYDCGLCNIACTSRLPLNQYINKLSKQFKDEEHGN